MNYVNNIYGQPVLAIGSPNSQARRNATKATLQGYILHKHTQAQRSRMVSYNADVISKLEAMFRLYATSKENFRAIYRNMRAEYTSAHCNICDSRTKHCDCMA